MSTDYGEHGLHDAVIDLYPLMASHTHTDYRRYVRDVSNDCLFANAGDWGAWVDEQDIFMPVSLWPRRFRYLLYGKTTSDERRQMILFFIHNGLDPHRAIAIAFGRFMYPWGVYQDSKRLYKELLDKESSWWVPSLEEMYGNNTDPFEAPF